MRQYLVRTGNAVEAAIQGLQPSSPFPIERVGSHFGVVYRGNSKRKVKLLTGGGSGHEPLFLGAVGPGMADGAIAGEIFTAPNPYSILVVSEALQPFEAVVYLYGNYTGDVLNFGFAAEEARAKGINVAEIRVHDDVASASFDAAAQRKFVCLFNGPVLIIAPELAKSLVDVWLRSEFQAGRSGPKVERIKEIEKSLAGVR